MYYDEYDWREYRGDVVWVGGFVFKSGKITIKPQRYGEDPFIYGTIEMESLVCLDCVEPWRKRVFVGEYLPYVEGILETGKGIILVKNKLIGGEINYEVIHINDTFAKSDWFEWITEDEEFYHISTRKARYLVDNETLWKLHAGLIDKVELKNGTLRVVGWGYPVKEYRGEIRMKKDGEGLEGDMIRLHPKMPPVLKKHIYGFVELYRDGKVIDKVEGELFWYVKRGKGMVVVVDREHPEKLTLNNEDLKAIIYINMKDEEEWEIPKMEGGAIIYGGVL
ncbi:hypothetical protein [Candidatus Aciduliprofundum boonei]|uniref:Uncharacterized protein n=1 Tax=Aciduliprofundum boonei (strain DSM 19572 / T469) TaxID=439481 RepID=B5IHA5_ACIB4|nr:hypothetical protein [Candidatus Aciduliprofundum boonei]ADD08856.1 hypothetical protein Aboo_1047 [Aciduliprofundum boonei T469]EDY34350.1 hypothetical protein ABOONEI_979 [Aciduliprofundum boonei T469]HII55610.1 hypothetical protein [Candidatus Aciduliprofundum boonei]